MFVDVQLLKGYRKPLLYQIPPTWDDTNLLGTILTVPFRKTLVPAIVIKTYEQRPENASFQIKCAHAIHDFPQDKLFGRFIEHVGRFYHLEPLYFYQRLRSFLASEEPKNDSQYTPSLLQTNKKTAVTLTDEQTLVVDHVNNLLDAPKFSPILLHGVTGSGKTEVYKQVMLSALTQGSSVLFLLPEVSLSLQFERILSAQLPAETPLFSFHSATKIAEKRKLWGYIQQQKPCIIIGVHLPVFLPLSRLGLIIIDEEHEDGFVEKKHPKINSKHAALLRAQIYNIPIILGSATPALNSLYQVAQKKWDVFRLTKRFEGTFPIIQQCLLSVKEKRRSFWISKELEKAIFDRLARKEQIIIYLNRRGYSFFVQCSSCGFIFNCNNCSVSLTLHNETDHPDRGTMRCHYCNYQQAEPRQCTGCKASGSHLIKKGIGTQQLTTTLQKLFPQARIARADLDTAKKKRSWHETVEQFSNGMIDILVGTQLITKGYHFPRVTLVGVIWADSNIHFPSFDATETTVQKLIQVAGRAGRSLLPSTVIVQSMQEYPFFNYINEEKYPLFCAEELVFRQQAGYPPFKRLTYIELRHTDEEIIDKEAAFVAQHIQKALEVHTLNVTLLGPSRPIVHRIQKTEMRQILLKSDSFADVQRLLDTLEWEDLESSIYITPHQ